jgi:opacity protein-like surface antigen
MKHLFRAALMLLVSTAAFAQPPDDRRPLPPPPDDTPPTLSIRPFVVGTAEAFAATNTFEAAFGRSLQPFFGGGVQVVFADRFFVEAGASRFKKDGERAFRYNGQTFRLGLPLTATMTPFEITGGYRFHFGRMPRIVPYAAGGFGSYSYKESSPSSDPSENVDTRHSGFVLNGGVEFRLHRWVGVGVDAQYTHIPGILGTGENDLGGIAGRVKFVVGR